MKDNTIYCGHDSNIFIDKNHKIWYYITNLTRQKKRASRIAVLETLAHSIPNYQTGITIYGYDTIDYCKGQVRGVIE